MHNFFNFLHPAFPNNSVSLYGVWFGHSGRAVDTSNIVK